MKYFSIDIETGGLDPEKESLLEVAVVFDDLKNPMALTDLPVFHKYIKAETYNISAWSGANLNRIFQILNEGTNPDIIALEQFIPAFKYWIKKCHNFADVPPINLAGKNIGALDMRFLDYYTNFTAEVKPNFRYIDPAILYFNLDKDESMPGMNKCLTRIGLSTDSAHDAVTDALDTVKLIRAKFLNTQQG